MLKMVEENKRLAVRARWMAEIEKDSLVNLFWGVVLAAPISLLWLSDGWAVMGLVYVGWYAIIMVLPTALYVIMAFDAVRVLFHKVAVFMPGLLAIAKAAHPQSPGRSLRRTILGLGVVGNPLAGVTRELWFLAFRFNPAALKALTEEADRLATQMNRRHGSLAVRLVADELRTVPHHAATVELVTC